MTRERIVDVYIPMGEPGDSGGGVGVVGAIAGLFTAVIGVGVVVCVAVSCTDFGPGSTIPPGDGCRPFCTATPTPAAVPAGAEVAR